MISGRSTSAYAKTAVLCIVLLSVACGSVVADDPAHSPAASADSFSVTNGVDVASTQLWQLSDDSSLVWTDSPSLSVAALPSIVADTGTALLDTVFGDSLLRGESTRITFTVFLGRLDAASGAALQRGGASPIQNDVYAAPPIEWMNPSADERLAEIDYFALMLSLTTVLVSIGLVAYRRLSAPTGLEREVEPSLVDPEPTPTDEECIMRLLEEHDGQMRQVAIVEEVEWSKAKVSRLLSRLDEEGEITKLRLGRENLICIRGCEPEASRSPFAAAPEN
ncbi:helix-turn-helix transcriptional regulator [Haloprofundus halobius]|uniref:helix-turn-helix transcriptional regulator n=1 Tax=Haloprofundus halobius TaxID=2876194 RepID=UPI001CCDF676|nr:helix-turn-helix domain-containing protein [Haloprofundus halobius]